MARAHVAWHELRNDLTDHRIPYRASESPRALTGRIATSLGLAGAERDALERIALAEERASYAISPADSSRLQADEALVRHAVARSCAASARWLAIIAPPSALIPVRAGCSAHARRVRLDGTGDDEGQAPPSDRMVTDRWARATSPAPV